MRIATANNTLHNTTQPGANPTNGPFPSTDRGGNAPLADVATEDVRAGHGSETISTADERAAHDRTTPGTAPVPREHRGCRAPALRPKTTSNGRKTKAAITLGTLNMSGRGTLMSGNSKWTAVNQLLRERRIGILALQETHLTDADAATVQRLFGRRICLVHSPDPDNPSAARGVAIALNRELVDTSSLTNHVLVPGRAILLTMHWHGEQQLTILNVYAPNSPTENAAFWSTLHHKLRSGRFRKPDAVVGDFNLVEEAIDRIPMRDSPETPLAAMKALLDSFSLRDGWRITNPTEKAYTFPQRGGPSRARLDRIYTTDSLLTRSLRWDISVTGVPTDHCLVSTNLTAARSPYIGKGRWTMPQHLLLDQEFMKRVTHLGATAMQKARRLSKATERSEADNPQTVLKMFKEQVREAARAQLKRRVPMLRREIARMEILRDEVQNAPGFADDRHAQAEASAIQQRLLELESRRHGNTRLATATHYELNAERTSKYWSAVNKARKPRDLFFALGRPGATEYETRSDRMANLARDYHDEIQHDGMSNSTGTPAREVEILDALSDVDAKLPSEDARQLGRGVTRAEVELALDEAGLGKASGLDGLPYEFWLKLRKRWEASTERSSPRFDCVGLLHLAYCDLETFGPCEAAALAEGWMCPLYKKKDRRDVSNYRPITLLNSDYKTYSKILAMRLAKVVHKIVHPDQAGFIPNRQIADQTQLCRTMVDYAEATEENGVIVALDQEKAYDKVAHDYLWEALRRFGLPLSFIRKVKALYRFATTVVILNGETSAPFLVVRGVRQGDPLSCLIFNIAIEPLACALRQSDLRGFKLPGAARKLVASLFADDTSAFLAASDKWATVWTIINRWCGGSRARFNTGKTEVIPVGAPRYRAAVAEHRSISGAECNQDERIPDGVHIARDGEAVRVLGAWVGNGVDQVAVWGPALQKIREFLRRWGHCSPSMAGKRSIVQMGPGGISQYLTTVQGMPACVEKELTKLIRDFMWDGRTPAPVSLDALCRPVDEGGLGLLDVRARNQAIELIWTKKYLTLGDSRPMWALAADVLISLCASREAGAIRRKAQLNTFLQTWAPALHSASPLPEYLKRMLSTAKKHNVSFAAVKLDASMKKALPIWYHLGATNKLRRLNNTRTSDCLRDCHAVRVVADALRVARRACFISASGTGNDYLPDDCDCTRCRTDRERGCPHPWRCCKAAERLLAAIRPKWHPDEAPPLDGLTLTKRRLEANAEAMTSGGAMTFNPSLTQSGDLGQAIRVFVDPSVHDEPPASRRARGRVVTAESCVVHIVGSPSGTDFDVETLPMGLGFARFVAGGIRDSLVFPALESEREAKGIGAITATLAATLSAPRDAPLHFLMETDDVPTMLFTKLPGWEDCGWVGIPNATYLRALVNQLRQRSAPTTFRTASGDDDRLEVVASRAAMGSALREEYPRGVHPVEKAAFRLSGARLDCLTQALAYKGIREKTAPPPRSRTTARVTILKRYLAALPGADCEEKDIWRGLRAKDIRRPVADFLWKGIHGAHRIGSFWLKIPGKEGRATCPRCDDVESLEHILVDCRDVGQELIWGFARAAWARTGIAWAAPGLSDILAVGPRSRALCGEDPAPKPLSRLWRILVSESAHLIWRLRCERVIGHCDEPGWQHTATSVAARWAAAVDTRLRRDIEGTRRKYGRLALKKSLVVSTWEGLLTADSNLSKDWAKARKVLVGIDPGLVALPGPGNPRVPH